MRNKYSSIVKPKTIVLLNENGEVESFGDNAKATYIGLNKTLQKKWMLFERFKMVLFAMTERKKKSILRMS